MWTGWLALCQSLVGIQGVSSGWVSLPALLLVAWLAARWGFVLGGAPGARMALLATAVYPRLGYYSTLAYAEASCAALLALSLSLLCLPGKSQRPWGAWAAGAVGGMAFLCHEVALVPVLLAAFLCLGRPRRMAAYAGGCVAIALADTAFKALLTGALLHRLHQAVDVTGSAHRAWYPGSAEVLRRILVGWWKPMLFPGAALFPFDAGLSALALLGWALAWRRRQGVLVRLGVFWALTLLAWDLLPSSIVPYVPALDAENPRHILPLALPLVLLAGNALQGIASVRGGRVLAGACLAFPLASCLILGIDARHRISVCRRIAARLDREPPAPVRTDPYSALILQGLLEPGRAARVSPFGDAFDPATASGYALWDPKWWRVAREMGRAAPDLESLRAAGSPIESFDQPRRPSLRGSLGLGPVPPRDAPATLYRLGARDPEGRSGIPQSR